MTEFYTSVIQRGNNILYRGYKDGRRVHLKEEFEPTIFVPAKTETKFKTLDNKYVDQIKPGSIKETKEFIERYKDVDGFEVYGMTQFQYQYIADKFPGEIKYDLTELDISVIDLECASELGFPDPKTAPEEILLISLYNKKSNRTVVWGSRSFNKNADDEFEYRLLKDEKSLLVDFLNYWQANTPDIISGWHINGFDIPYLINRIARILGEEWIKYLSPWNIVTSREFKNALKKTEVDYDIFGVTILDYMDLYKKYTYSSQESYALGFIAQQELGENKKEIEGSFKNAYTNHYDNFVRYNAWDSILVGKLEDKLRFIEIACTVAYLAKCNIKDTFGPVKTWDVFIYNYLKSKNVVIPPQTQKHGGEFEGAWVKDPIVGFHGWTMSFDFSALYPSIIRQWNMSPETIVGVIPGVNVANFLEFDKTLLDGDFTFAANGALFSKDKLGIVPEVVKVIIDGRKIAKKEMLSLEQELEMIKSELKSRNQ